MRTECLVCGGPRTTLEVRVRFLQVLAGSWQNAVERTVAIDKVDLGAGENCRQAFRFPIEGGDEFIEGSIAVTARAIEEGLFCVAVEVTNESSFNPPQGISRDDVLPYSLAAAHTILAVRDGTFVSLLDPPEQLREAVAGCRNQGTWPVLAGDPGQSGFLLSSPIILYDYPQIAPESPGDLFDGAEIDEILTLRILTLTDEEKREVRNGDERARRILERTETLPQEHLMKLHGALRGLRPAGEAQ